MAIAVGGFSVVSMAYVGPQRCIYFSASVDARTVMKIRWSVELHGEDGRVFGSVAKYRWRRWAERAARKEAEADVRWNQLHDCRWVVVLREA